MRPITRRLRLFAALLGLAQGALPALALAHELAVRDYAGFAAHAEPLGATHEISAHSHDCGMCRNVVSKVGLPSRRSVLVDPAPGSRARMAEDRPLAARGDHGPAALPRAPPIG